MDFINHLLSFSSRINNLELDKTSVNSIISLEENYYREDFLDPYCDSFQINLINAKEIMVARIINNFDEAIKSKCGNDIDLSEYTDKDYWNYGYKTDDNQRNINNRYYDIRLTPKDEEVFKKLWLRSYIKDLSKIVSNIRKVRNYSKQAAIDKSKNDVTIVKKVKGNNKLSIRDKKIYNLVEELNLKIDFLRDDILPKEFVSVLIRKSEKNIHLNIDNGSFHYLLNKLGYCFNNFSMTSVANTDKIYSSKGSILKVKNLNNSKSNNPKHKDAIDEVFKNFQ
jgi:hypothetical protein